MAGEASLMWLLLALGFMLATARALGELCTRLHQPTVLGEVAAGVLLGPTVLGALAPAAAARLFPSAGAQAAVLDGVVQLALVLFLFVAGLEVDLSLVWRHGRRVLAVGSAGMVVPFALGTATALALPDVLQNQALGKPWISALVLGFALSITALPVVTRTLQDLGLYRSGLGMVIVASAVLDDLAGWLGFSALSSLSGDTDGVAVGVAMLALRTALFAVLLLTAGRALIHRALPWVVSHTHWPGGALGFLVASALLASAASEWLGIHAAFGSFLVGVAAGSTPEMRAHTRRTLSQFIGFVFAPLFFASIGLQVDFLTHLDLPLLGVVLVLATVGKVVGCFGAGLWSGASRREALAIGFGMNARGAMEIVLSALALRQGLIHESMFVALVGMSLATSMMAGPVIRLVLRLGRRHRFVDYLSPRAFVPRLAARTREEAIVELAAAAAEDATAEADSIVQAAQERERLEATGLGNGLAMPRARVSGVTSPVVALGLADAGIEFDAPDGRPARVVALVITPQEAATTQLEICADIARTFSHPDLVARLLDADCFTEAVAILQGASGIG